MSSALRVLFIGDIVGSSGRDCLRRHLPNIKKEKACHLVIANAENAAHGFGLTLSTAEEIFNAGVDVLSGGNHIWDKKEVNEVFDRYPDRIIRPANYPPDLPGKPYVMAQSGETRLAILNLMGRVFMDPLDCPFRTFSSIYAEIRQQTKLILVDFHAEATSEKSAFAWYVDGKVSFVVGSHTHVQTADERILPQGTGFLSDAGMTGPYDSVIGMKTDIILRRFLEKIPIRMEVAEGRGIIQGVIFDIDRETGRCLRVERLRLIDGE